MDENMDGGIDKADAVADAVLRVSLTPALKREAAVDKPPPLLDIDGPWRCLGAATGSDGLAIPVQPGPATLFGPRGACLLGESGPLWVSDTGHHRLLGWKQLPASDDTPADWLIGQRDFFHEGRNGKGEPGAATLNVPTGIVACGAGLAVADAWNHRVLVWWRAPTASHVAADIVLGQEDFSAVDANRGAENAAADSLFWPYGLHWDGERLWVADTGNRRVLMWRGVPQRSGQPADLVLGHDDFRTRDENGGGNSPRTGMRWPHAMACWQGRFCVADAGNNRVMVWNTVPLRDNTPCDLVLGQADFSAADHNRALYWPTAHGLNMPYGITVAGDWLLVADTANSRLLGWHGDDCRFDGMARALSGQADFQAKGDNRWQLPVRDSLCWPYGIQACGDTVVVADSGNNRVQLWRFVAGWPVAAT